LLLARHNCNEKKKWEGLALGTVKLKGSALRALMLCRVHGGGGGGGCGTGRSGRVPVLHGRETYNYICRFVVSP
jgi:hypothetical protein